MTRSRGGELMANFWQGEFPWRNSGAKGWRGTSPVGLFPANGFGLPRRYGKRLGVDHRLLLHRPAQALPRRGVPAAQPPLHPAASEHPAAKLDHGCPGASIPRRVIKGGSHLCAPSYCLRFRPAARQPEAVDTSTSDIGFRCITREAT